MPGTFLSWDDLIDWCPNHPWLAGETRLAHPQYSSCSLPSWALRKGFFIQNKTDFSQCSSETALPWELSWVLMIKTRGAEGAGGAPQFPNCSVCPQLAPKGPNPAANTPWPWRRTFFLGWQFPKGHSFGVVLLFYNFILFSSPHLAAAGMCEWSCFITQSRLQALTQDFLGG